jgi:hypothetical protein
MILQSPKLETVEAGLAAEFTQTPEGVSLESRQLVSEFSLGKPALALIRRFAFAWYR